MTRREKLPLKMASLRSYSCRSSLSSTALAICFIIATLTTEIKWPKISVVAAVSPDQYKSLPKGGGFKLSFPWSSSSFHSSSRSPPASKSSARSMGTRGGAAAASSTPKKRVVVKGSSSYSSPYKGGTIKKKKVVKRIVSSPNNVSGPRNAKITKAVPRLLPEDDRYSPQPSDSGRSKIGDTMPSIFRIPAEEKYDRYAAALAVTEGLRRVRDVEIERAISESRSTNGGKNWKWGGISNDKDGKPPGKPGTRSRSKVRTPKEELEERKKRAESAYILQSTKAVRALGMTVTQFNQIGREILADAALKERVSEQAYLYRMASAINLERVPLLEDPASKKLLQSHRRYRVQMFARSISEIEDLRTDQIEALRQSLHVERFPPGFDLSDPNVQPLLHPEVRAVCEAFPLRAEEIVKRYGLESDEFNQMLEETKGNPIFRWRVKKYVEKAEEEKAKGKKVFGESSKLTNYQG